MGCSEDLLDAGAYWAALAEGDPERVEADRRAWENPELAEALALGEELMQLLELAQPLWISDPTRVPRGCAASAPAAFERRATAENQASPCRDRRARCQRSARSMDA